MNPSYSPDNTRSSMTVILLLAAGVTLVALLLGLSEKPDVAAIGVSVTADEVNQFSEGEGVVAAQPTTAAAELDDATFSVPASTDGDTSTASVDQGAPASSTDAAGSPAATAIAVTPIPLDPTPEPTPEIAAAVDTAALPGTAEDSDDDLDAALATSQVRLGTIAGEFFTRTDEDAGATVARNEITVTLNDDGTGTFAAVLDMTLADSTAVLIGMSGPIRWSTTETPHVFSEVGGTYTIDSPIDANDTSSDRAELTISSLVTGSGSLCPDSCYGFNLSP